MRKLFAVLLLGVTVLALSAPVDAGDRNFVAHLSARDEVPSNESLAQGQAIVDLRADGTQLDYKLIAAKHRQRGSVRPLVTVTECEADDEAVVGDRGRR